MVSSGPVSISDAIRFRRDPDSHDAFPDPGALAIANRPPISAARLRIDSRPK